MISNLQTYALEIKDSIKTIPRLAGVWLQRTFPTRNVYPCAIVFYETETNLSDAVDLQVHERSAVFTVAVFVQGTQDAEKAEAELIDLKEKIVRKLTHLKEHEAVIKYGGATFAIQALDEEQPDAQPLISRVEIRFQIDYHVDIRADLGTVGVNDFKNIGL